ncbi:type II secretion system F family protein [Streptomyces sp. AV19]|uniref:type II secretion system F family protein n=1 Tax=Streptomyces sp. AV19 TaxID=2793068 RepID=UPI0018FEBDBE|nr:type II secretion system F family protein [Streptomyces sp. AV19]MBH1934874.1 type II secretion system F family protein [Streptomyces sp. AV19]MDG4537008.1 type II secretion system F family protein [Streptomyces sp. AV19]
MTVPMAVPQTLLAATALLGVAAATRPSVRRGRELRRARALFADGSATGVRFPLLPARLREAAGRLLVAARGRRELWCLPAGCAVCLLGGSFLPLLMAGAAVPLMRRWLAARLRRRERERREDAVIELCGAVAGDLRAGRQPGEALVAAPGDALGASWPAVTAAARFGGDVPAALREAGLQPGAEGLTGVAACWQVAVDGGAGLAAGLERVGAALAAERDQREDLHAQLAGTRSTAVMLALLPVLALLMGSAMGADPLRVLFHTPAGLGCLALGGLLEYAGLLWTRRIVCAAGGREE